jgi:FMN phosphatase YigB (HAD superfamily)
VWPFERALSLSGVEPARTLFISANSSALGEANQVGLMAMHPDVDEVERLLL